MRNLNFKDLTVEQLQALRGPSNSPEDLSKINAAIIAKIAGVRTLVPFISELEYAIAKDDGEHIQKILTKFTIASSFMTTTQLLLLDTENECHRMLKEASSEMCNLTVEDCLLVRGEGDYAKRGAISKS